MSGENILFLLFAGIIVIANLIAYGFSDEKKVVKEKEWWEKENEFVFFPMTTSNSLFLLSYFLVP